MDVISGATTIVTALATALATGALAGVEPAAKKAVEDGYDALKDLLKKKFSLSSLEPLERKPDSEPEQDSVAEDLTTSGADKDTEVLEAATKLIKLIESKAPESASAAGFTLEWVHAAGNVTLKNITASGPIVMRHIDAGSDFTLDNAHAGTTHDPNA